MRFCVENKMNIALQGEIVGPGINGNKENMANHDFFLFNIYDINKHCYLSSADR
jgi:hypothetical protein